MSGAKNHDYHILPPDPWPIIGSFSALVMAAGGIMWMHEAAFGGWVFFAGLAAVLYTMYAWWSNVVREANAGDHTPVVGLHLRYGMILFIASEVMFFVGWFWAWFNYSLFPAAVSVASDGAVSVGDVAAVWPPKGIEVIDPFHLPLLNTLILLCSGTTVTWAHHELIHGNRDGFKKGLWATIALGVLFTSIQAYEYGHAPFALRRIQLWRGLLSWRPAFTAFHVLVGTIFLDRCVWCAPTRVTLRHAQHFGFEAAAWYWHFVDVVWLFLFIVAIYVWGGWGAPVHG